MLSDRSMFALVIFLAASKSHVITHAAQRDGEEEALKDVSEYAAHAADVLIKALNEIP